MKLFKKLLDKVNRGLSNKKVTSFKGFKLGLGSKIILIYIITTIVLVTGIIYQVYNTINDLLTTTSLQTNANLALEIIDARYPGNWRIEGDRLYKGATLINDNNELVNTIKRSTNGEVTIFARDTRIATTIVDNGVRQVGTKAPEDVIEQVLKRGLRYSGTGNIFGERYSTYYVELRDIGGNIVGMFFIGYPMSYINGLVFRYFREIIIVALAIMVLAIIGYFIFIRIRITKGIAMIKGNIQSMAKGDLTNNVSEKLLKRQDELGEMAKAVEEMIESMENIIKNIKEKSEQLNINSESLATASGQMAASSQELASTMNQVAEGTSSQAQDLEAIVCSLNQLSGNIENVNIALENMKLETENTQTKANAGKKEMEGLVKSIEGIKNAFELVVDKVENLTNSIKEISGISTLISNISEQTNLLALNAAIEAARAGEHGRGFAVVAEEVRKLADESRKSTEQIISLVNSITKDTDEVIQTSMTVEQSVNNQAKSIEKTVASFGDIIQSVNNIAPLMTKTFTAVDDMIKSKDGVMEKAEQVSAVTEETAAATEEVAASSQELTASSQEVSVTAQSLREIAKDLMDSVDRFKV